VIKAERAKRKAETVQSDIVGYYPRSKLPFRGIHLSTRTSVNSCRFRLTRTVVKSYCS